MATSDVYPSKTAQPLADETSQQQVVYPPGQQQQVVYPPGQHQQVPYPPAQQQQVAYPPGQQHGTTTTTTIIAQPTTVPVMTTIFFGGHPVALTCPHCQAQIVTNTSYEPGTLAWLVCCGLACVGCYLGCCLIPFCVDDLQDCRHSCPNCNNFLGVYRRI